MRGSADGSWRGVVEQPNLGQTVYHPRRLRHEPTAVIFNTFGSYKDTAGTLPVGTRLTLTPVGEWMGTTRIELGMARTPKFWLMVMDEAETKNTRKGHIPLATGESFWLAWSKDGIWARKPRFPDDTAQLGLTNNSRRRRHSQAKPHQNFVHQNQDEHRTASRAVPEPSPIMCVDPAREMQYHWREEPGTETASSSADRAPTSDDANSNNLLDNLDNVLQTLLQQSFLQPREEVTDLAYRACSRLLELRRSLAGELQGPAPADTFPDGDRPMQTNPLAEAQVILRQLALQHEEMATGQLRRALQQVQEILDKTRRLVDTLGAHPHPSHWHEALAGIRNVANEADAWDWQWKKEAWPLHTWPSQPCWRQWTEPPHTWTTCSRTPPTMMTRTGLLGKEEGELPRSRRHLYNADYNLELHLLYTLILDLLPYLNLRKVAPNTNANHPRAIEESKQSQM
eukprot:s3505_g8.t2